MEEALNQPKGFLYPQVHIMYIFDNNAKIYQRMAQLENNGQDILTDVIQQLGSVKRKSLLPWWIKVFMWFFMITAVITLVGCVMASFGYNYEMSLYGLTTYDAFSLVGILITLLFTFKGVAAFGLFRETDWAIKIAMIDALVGIAVCVLMMVLPFIKPELGIKFTFRLELALLFPYFIRLKKIKPVWENVVHI